MAYHPYKQGRKDGLAAERAAIEAANQGDCGSAYGHIQDAEILRFIELAEEFNALVPTMVWVP